MYIADVLAIIKYLSETINKVGNEDKGGANEAFEMAKKEFQSWMGGSSEAGIAFGSGKKIRNRPIIK